MAKRESKEDVGSRTKKIAAPPFSIGGRTRAFVSEPFLTSAQELNWHALYDPAYRSKFSRVTVRVRVRVRVDVRG